MGMGEGWTPFLAAPLFNIANTMATYTVTGYDDTVKNVDILGELKYVGDTVELTEDVAAPLVEAGKLAPLGNGAPLTAPSTQSAPSEQVPGSSTLTGEANTEPQKLEVTSETGSNDQTVPVTTTPPVA